MNAADTALRVVIAEDSEADAHLAGRALKRHGISARVVIACTEPEFRRALVSTLPHIIISDNSMPRFSGRRALEIARELAPATPFIYLSGSVIDRGAEGDFSGANACLDKLHLDQLGEVVARLL